MEINIPGPTKPAYLDKIRFDFANKSDKPFEELKGRAVFVTDVGVVIEPRGRPV